VDYYVDQLLAEPAWHDKVEFNIVFSCYTFVLAERLSALDKYGFDSIRQERLKRALLSLTSRVMNKAAGPWSRDRAAIEELRRRRPIIAPGRLSPVARIFWLLEDCRQRGTRPFAGLARAGFMAVQMLESLVELGIFDASDRRDFLMGLETVSSQMMSDTRNLDRGGLLDRYGHLRPGTYDILSNRYDEAPEFYFDRERKVSVVSDVAKRMPQRAWCADGKLDAVGRLLSDHGFECGAEDYLDFLRVAICERERSKFEFTRNLSDALSAFTAWGQSLSFSRDELSYADIGVVRQCHGGARDAKAVLEESIKRGQRDYAVTMATALPPLIAAPQDVWGFHLPRARPNFITSNVAIGEVRTDLSSRSIEGCVLMLPNADPGYDWIFTKNIAGFITAYGGTNSHMAIRASELDLPAVIGAGERLFTKWREAAALKIDCPNRLVEVLPSIRRHETHRRYAAR
jgi:hypothetical protein